MTLSESGEHERLLGLYKRWLEIDRWTPYECGCLLDGKEPGPDHLAEVRGALNVEDTYADLIRLITRATHLKRAEIAHNPRAHKYEHKTLIAFLEKRGVPIPQELLRLAYPAADKFTTGDERVLTEDLIRCTKALVAAAKARGLPWPKVTKKNERATLGFSSKELIEVYRDVTGYLKTVPQHRRKNAARIIGDKFETQFCEGSPTAVNRLEKDFKDIHQLIRKALSLQ